MSLLSAREANAADYPIYARLCPELGPEAVVQARDKWIAESAPRTIFLERDGEVVAYGLFNIYERSGYVVQCVVDPRARREGVGRAILLVLADRFRRAGCSTWALDVKIDNAPALALYERL